MERKEFKDMDKEVFEHFRERANAGGGFHSDPMPYFETKEEVNKFFDYLEELAAKEMEKRERLRKLFEED